MPDASETGVSEPAYLVQDYEKLKAKWDLIVEALSDVETRAYAISTRRNGMAKNPQRDDGKRGFSAGMLKAVDLIRKALNKGGRPIKKARPDPVAETKQIYKGARLLRFWVLGRWLYHRRHIVAVRQRPKRILLRYEVTRGVEQAGERFEWREVLGEFDTKEVAYALAKQIRQNYLGTGTWWKSKDDGEPGSGA